MMQFMAGCTVGFATDGWYTLAQESAGHALVLLCAPVVVRTESRILKCYPNAVS